MPGFNKVYPQQASLSNEEFPFEGNRRHLTTELERGLLFENLGLNIRSAEDPVPESNGVPRIFVLKDGKVSSLSEANAPVGSREFWEAAMLGQLFAYPAGEKHPVQINAYRQGSHMTHEFSDPLDPENMPETEFPSAPQAPRRKPRWYHRLFKFGNNKKICDTYDRYVRDRAKWESDRKAAIDLNKSVADSLRDRFGSRRTPEFLQAEKDAAEAVREENEERKRQRHAEENLRNTISEKGKAEKEVAGIHSFYKARPEINEEWIAPPKQEELAAMGLEKDPGPKRTGSIYTEKQFRDIPQLDISGLEVGGKPVTDREFASLAVFSTLTNDIGMGVAQQNTDPDILVKTFMEKRNFSEEDAKGVILDNFREIFTTSMIGDPPRADSGSYFKSAVIPGRERAQKALQEYRSGNKAELAGIISTMISTVSRDNYSRLGLGSQFMAENKIALDVIGLMDRDDELKKMVQDHYEKTENSYYERHPDTVRPQSFESALNSFHEFDEIEKLRQKGLDSSQELLQARVDGRELSDADKERCTRDILRFRAVEAHYLSESESIQYSAVSDFNKTYRAMEDKALDTLPVGGLTAKNGSSLPIAPYSVFTLGYGHHCVPQPGILKKIGNEAAMKDLDATLDKVIKNEGLDKLSTKELSDTLSDDTRFVKREFIKTIVRSNQPQKQTESPQPQKTAVREEGMNASM